MAINLVTSRLSGQPGRYLLQAREQHLVVDASTGRGGPGQAWQAAELLLGALITCSNAVIEDEARKASLPLAQLEIKASCEPDEQNPGHYLYIRLEYVFTGLSQEKANHLVEAFKQVCPIYGSLSRGAPVNISVIAQD